MTEYQMPVLSEQEREEAVISCEADLLHLQMTLEASEKADRSNAQYLRKMVLRHKIALAALTAKPVAFTAQDNIDGFGRSVGYMWPPGNEKKSDTALYMSPLVPAKQEGEQ